MLCLQQRSIIALNLISYHNLSLFGYFNFAILFDAMTQLAPNLKDERISSPLILLLLCYTKAQSNGPCKPIKDQASCENIFRFPRIVISLVYDPLAGSSHLSTYTISTCTSIIRINNRVLFFQSTGTSDAAFDGVPCRSLVCIKIECILQSEKGTIPTVHYLIGIITISKLHSNNKSEV